MDPDFCKKVMTGQEGQKSSKNCPKMSFSGFLTKIKFIDIYLLIEYERTNGPLTFCKNYVLGKNLVLELPSKNL